MDGDAGAGVGEEDVAVDEDVGVDADELGVEAGVAVVGAGAAKGQDLIKNWTTSWGRCFRVRKCTKSRHRPGRRRKIHQTCP